MNRVTLSAAEQAGAKPTSGDLVSAINQKQCARAFKAVLKKMGLPVDAKLHVERVLFSERRPTVIMYRWRSPDRPAGGYLIGELIGDGCDVHAQFESSRIRKSRRGQWTSDRDDPVIAVPELGLAVRGPGVDAKLPGLRLLHDTRLAVHSVCRILGIAESGTEVRTVLRSQRLGKRAILQIDCKHRGGESRLFARLSPASHAGGQRRFFTHRLIETSLMRVHRHRALQVPAAVGFDPALCAAIYRGIEGKPANVAGTSDADIAAAGHLVLKQLRLVKTVIGPTHPPIDEIESLEPWADRLRQYRPQHADSYSRAVTRVRRQFSQYSPSCVGLCHRDLHPGQILISHQRTGLIDFDTICQSDPAIDAGNLLAHLQFADQCHLIAGRGQSGASLLASMQSERSSAEIEQIQFWARVAMLRVAAIHAFGGISDSQIQKAIHVTMYE